MIFKLIDCLNLNVILNSMKIFCFSLQQRSIFVLLFLLFSINYLLAQEEESNQTVEIPEPLMFDLVRGLGAMKGELEINALVDLPINNISSREVEWAPEIEYAVFNNFAVELEFPFENFELEAYKVAVQWTIGRSKSNKFIHGIQVIGESYIHDDLLELSFLYVPAYRFSDTWSAIGLFGLMVESGEDAPSNNTTVLLNASVFANLNEHVVVGIEINNSDPTLQKVDDNDMELLILPQLHHEFESGFSFQVGIGPKFDDSQTEWSGVLRVIQTF